LFNIKKNYFYYFLLIYLIISITASLNVGITHDERFDLHNFQLQQNIISNFFLKTDLNTEYLYGEKAYMSAFYGVGFHFFSYPFEKIFSFIFISNDFSNEGLNLILKHPSIIIFFALSGFYLRKIMYIITQDINFSSISGIFYLLYPYVLGHSFFNTKDIPFMSVWLICTYFFICILKKFYEKNKIDLKMIILLGFLTSYLFSVRIIGLLIFIEFIIFITIFLYYKKLKFISFSKIAYKPIALFSLIFLLGVYILNPNFWEKPQIIFQAVNFFKNHIQSVCTLTLGECMKAQNLSPTYLPIWIFFKIPIIILSGFILIPLVEKRIFKKDFNGIVFGSLLTTIVSIILILIFTNAILYDELRHVLFLVPLIFIVSLASSYYFFSKKVIITILFINIIFFTFQNVKIFPYNYVWLNNFSHFLKVKNNFELDYWGVSTKNIANVLYEKNKSDSACILTNNNFGIAYFFGQNSKKCFLPFNRIDKKNQRPFYIALIERKLNKGLPNNCKKIHEEVIYMNFSKEKLTLAKVFKCD
jgi:hypothetical protein